MPRIFASFLVTACALTSCHVVISKQGSMIRSFWYNRCVTGRRPRDENHAVIFGLSAENRSRARDTQPIRSSLTNLQGGASFGTPVSLKKIWKEVVSLRKCLSIYLSTNNKLWALFENKMRDIILKTSVFRSFIIFDYVSVCICIAAIKHQEKDIYSYTNNKWQKKKEYKESRKRRMSQENTNNLWQITKDKRQRILRQ